MMKHEFEKLAWYEVSSDDYYTFIEPMYMAVDVDKAEFVKMVDRKRFEIVRRTEKDVIREMKKAAQKCYEVWGRSRDHEAEEKLDSLVRELQDKFNLNVYLHREYEYPGFRGCSTVTELRYLDGYGCNSKTVKLIKEVT